MKNLLLVLIFVFGLLYYFVPGDIQKEYLEKVGIDSSFITIEEEIYIEQDSSIVELRFDSDSKIFYNGSIKDQENIDIRSLTTGMGTKCISNEQYGKYFSSKTVLHRVLLGKSKDVLGKLKLEEGKTFNIFTYKTTALNNTFPPDLSYVYECKFYTSTIGELDLDIKGLNAPSDIVIGIVGEEGSYGLELEEK